MSSMANILREHGFFFLFGPDLENNFVVFGCTKNLSLSLSLSLYIYIYIYIYLLKPTKTYKIQ